MFKDMIKMLVEIGDERMTFVEFMRWLREAKSETGLKLLVKSPEEAGKYTAGVLHVLSKAKITEVK